MKNWFKFLQFFTLFWQVYYNFNVSENRYKYHVRVYTSLSRCLLSRAIRVRQYLESNRLSKGLSIDRTLDVN